MSSEITLSTHLQSKARSADRQEYRCQNQTASFPISPANLSKHTSLQCFQGKSSIQLCEVWLSQWPCALPAGSPGAFLPGKLCSLTSRGWAQDGQVGWQMVAWGCSSAGVDEGPGMSLLSPFHFHDPFIYLFSNRGQVWQVLNWARSYLFLFVFTWVGR